MEREFVNYDEALVLKELGFSKVRVENTNKSVLGYYYDKKFIPNRGLRLHGNFNEDSAVAAPLYQQAFEHLLAKIGMIEFSVNYLMTQEFTYSIREIDFSTGYKEYEFFDSKLECLKKLIEIAKKDDK